MRNLKFYKTLAAVLLSLFLTLDQTALLASAASTQKAQAEQKYNWNLSEIYSSSQDFEKDFSKIKNDSLPKLIVYKDKLKDTNLSIEKDLLECLKLNEQISRTLEKLYVYSHMRSDANQADNEAAELSSRTETLNSEVSSQTSFIQTSILKFPEEKIRKYINNPDFKDYKTFFISLLNQKNHMLSEGEEALLALASDISGSPNDIYNKVTLADMTFPTIKNDKGQMVKLTPGLYSTALESKSREYRKAAFEGMLSSYSARKNTIAATLNAEVKKNIFNSKARKYNSSLEAALYSEGVPREVYDNLVKSVNKNLPYLHKYVELRRKVLSLDKVHSYDMYVPLTKDYQMNIRYLDAVKLANNALKPLGEDYLKKFNDGINSRWIDVFEAGNKYTGAYTWGSYDTHPYILLNYTDNLDSALTLCHEMGHAINSVYSNSTQPYTSSNPPIFTAEVASTGNELLVMDYLIKNAKNDDEKLFLLNQQVENIRGTMYTQVMFAEFEQAIHERVEKGEALSSDTLNKMWLDLLKKYNGNSYGADDAAGIGWARVPHFYMDFYVYKYATAMSASNQLVKNIIDGKEGAVDKYINFLKAGSADDPITTLKNAGVDMTSSQPVDELLSYFGSLVIQMEQILVKQGRIK